MLIRIMLVVSLSLPGSLWASTRTTGELPEIHAQQVQLRQQALAGQGRFKELGAAERQALVAQQDRFLALTKGRQSLDELSMDDKLAAINTLEAINATITRAEDERLVCERIKQVGSHRPTRICRTVAELREARQAAEKLMEERPSCGPSCRDTPKMMGSN
ncbi:hypothetical protein ASD77_04310 [Pseudoxanthomonas sp. Root65]|uniref:hypothetical protein n=1 Tax=Pseudoxanthomonas sp. Root65 TaxID=1736576 RepID=UPI0007006CB0|nr:hypothetical protein [Pseudoxanthomonas sp. Root65]KRA53871.1 hypothetical protein ASD77_04310 [Pseudoxanthomonas sp. Root65]